MRVRSSLAVALLAGTSLLGAADGGHRSPVGQSPAARCAALAGQSLALPDAATHIDSAAVRPAADGVAESCDVTVTVAPQIGLQIRLPADGWNGKFFEIGRGGYCRPVQMAQCDGPLRKGYACVIDDQGHKQAGSDDVWAHGNLQAKVDCGFRGNHVTALAGKAIVERFYGTKPSHAYFMGCSTGGRMAMVEAERFPEDFDGIVAGAPPVAKFANGIGLAWTALAMLDDAGKPLLTPADLRLLHGAALAQCDARDGLKDGIVGAAERCHVDPTVLQCRADGTAACLTPQKISAVRRIYAGPRDSAGRSLYPGAPLPGSELNWIDSYLPSDGKPSRILAAMTDMFRYLNEPARPADWQLSRIDWDHVASETRATDAFYTAANPDLRAFKARGGKLIIYNGLSDEFVMPGAIVDYYRALTRTMGGAPSTRDFARLFLVPGLNHCLNGPGAGVIDHIAAIEDWVEKGRAPDRLIGIHQTSPADMGFSRPVYPWPAEARYAGRGAPPSADSFVPVTAGGS